LYYALAVAIAVRRKEASTQWAIREQFVGDQDSGFHQYLENDVLLDRGIEIARYFGLITIKKDKFGPDLIRKSESYWDAWKKMLVDFDEPFNNYELATDSANDWLLSALVSVNDQYRDLKITASDFEKPNVDWEPITLDRKDEKLIAATEALEKTLEDLRSDNGYGIVHSEEKNFVFDKLTSVTKRLKEDTQISWMYLREFAFKPLVILIKRFGKAAIGVVSEAAKTALKEWLKKKGITFLDGL